MKIHVGTSGYGYKEWQGSFYPEKIRPREMLRFYGAHLSAGEINYTFYHMPTAKVLSSWVAQVPDDFTFAFKAPQIITHRKRLRNADEETEYFFRTLRVLGGKTGPVLFQFPKSFQVDRSVLEDFLALIPGDMHCAFEFRGLSRQDPEIPALLRQKKCSLCIADTDENPAEAIISTAPWGYLRLRRSAYSEADLALWREKILSQKWQRAYVFFKHEEEGRGPAAAVYFQELVGAKKKKSRHG